MSASPTRDSWSWLPRGFASTRWSLIRRAGNSELSSEVAAGEICRLYWHPLYTFLRSKGYGHETAQDHVQTFFARLLSKGWLKRAERSRGRFRFFMMRLIERHAARAHARSLAAKWGGGVHHVPYDSAEAQRQIDRSGCLGTLSPEDHFRRALAVQLFDEALALLRAKYVARRDLALLDELLPALEGHLVDESYADLGARLGKRPGAVKVAVLRMRQRFRVYLRDVAAAALRMRPGPELDEELRELFS